MAIKSVHITNYYHKNSGGISTSYNDLLAAAERHQRFVTLIVPGETEEVEQVNEFAKIYYVPAIKSPLFDKRYRLIMPWQYLFHDTAVRKILLAEEPDMIEVCDKYTLNLLASMIRTGNFKKLGRPMLVLLSCERMDDNIASFMTKGKLGKWLARSVMGLFNLAIFDFYLANSHYTAQEFDEAIEARRNHRFFNKIWRYFRASKIPEKERVFVCPCGLDFEYFAIARKSDEVKREMRERANIPADSIVLLYAGRISPEKNIELLTDLMKVLSKAETRDFRLLVAGAGPKADWLKAETDKLFPNKIVLLGHLDKETLASYYANADVFVHPNPREPFGIGPLEAMASGVPVVAPNSGGILSYATQENAWLVEPTGENFANAILEIIENPELRRQKLASAFETAKANTRQQSTDSLFETYDKMYQDFSNRKELFAYTDKTNFDFSKEIIKNLE